MKTIFAILIALFSININAQTTYTLEQLVGTKWKALNTPENIVSTYEFTTTEYKHNWKIYSRETGLLKKDSGWSEPFYLSNAIPSSFDHSKVGKVKKGSYIILYNDKMKTMEYYYIKTLTKDKLVLFHKKAPKDMDDEDYTVYYVRVK